MTSADLAFDPQARSHPLKTAFLKWQCRVRQNAMRDHFGRPDDGIMPEVFLAGQSVSLGHIVTVMNKTPFYSVIPELKHMLLKTNDPAQRRNEAIQYFSAHYYQKAVEFSDTLTASFGGASKSANEMIEIGKVCLKFDAFAQQFELDCKVNKLEKTDPYFQATIVHNKLFNPDLPPDTMVLGFTPDWEKSTSMPELG